MTVTIYPPSFQFTGLLQGGALPVATAAVAYFAPPASLSTDNAITSFEAFAVTPKATTFSILPHASGSYSFPTVDDAADVDLNAAFPGQHDEMGDIRRLIVSARRKPGSTASIAAQTVTIRKNDGAGTTLGTFKVPAAAASTELPSCGIDVSFITGEITGLTAYHFTVTAADPELELLCMVFGEN